MEPSMTSLREQAAVLALSRAAPGHWYKVGDLLEAVGSAEQLLHGPVEGLVPDDAELAAELASRVTPADVDAWEETLTELLAEHAGVSMITVFDDDYPRNLREVYDRPPFIFVRGAITPKDDDAIAVVGTRRASPEGRAQARALAQALAERSITVVSGLAAGIDTEAHRGALEAGGRTVAVLGTGILRTYPAENRDLADEIAGRAALISQFEPDAPPRQSNFPIRNAVSSGMALGTVVVEASATSGARMQARLALEHGKRLFLVEELVLGQEWAQKFARRPNATVVRSVDEILPALAREHPPREEQLTLT
jgi:DNA processing protein